ncbi:MAG: FkbM family methyltransferase, partial [Chloroflexi bacterium]|nr:FkbM family methyltransferase [Chloroflexota bacterium]
EFPEVVLVECERGGPSRARNIGTRLAQGQFIQYLDADDLLAPGKLARQLEVLQSTAADVAYGDWCELRARPDGMFEPGKTVSRPLIGDPQIALFTDFWCPPAAYLFRREIVDRVRTWNEGLPIIQDARFALDCALNGARFVHAPGLAAYYRQHAAGSVSTRDPLAFTRDCLENALQVERIWARDGGLSKSRTRALVQVYGQVARGTYSRAPELFEAAVGALERLQPGYRPSAPWHLALASRLLGYRRAESAALQYRTAKRVLPRRAVKVVCAFPGGRAVARHGLKYAVQSTKLPWQRKQQLHNLLAQDAAPKKLGVCALPVAGSRPLQVKVPVRDDLTRYWYFWGYAHYERGTVALLRKLLTERRSFVDVGANVGYFTFLAASMLEGRGEVHAFEPRSDCFADLERNTRQNRLECVRLHRVALADVDGDARLFIPQSGGWTNASLSRDFAGSEVFETVPTMRFETYCQKHDVQRIELMKIDAEGAELRVLHGMGSLLDAWRPDLIVEVLEPFEAELRAFFADSGYTPFRILDQRLEELPHIMSHPHYRNVYLRHAA